MRVLIHFSSIKLKEVIFHPEAVLGPVPGEITVTGSASCPISVNHLAPLKTCNLMGF